MYYFVVFTIINGFIMIITDYLTLVKHVLLKIPLDSIQQTEIKQLQDLNYIKRTQNIKKSHTQQIEEPSNRIEKLTGL